MQKTLDNYRELSKLQSTFTTVSPLTVVRFMVKPGVPPNAGLFVIQLDIKEH